MDELEELVKTIFNGTPNDAMNCLVRYIEFGDWLDDESQSAEIERNSWLGNGASITAISMGVSLDFKMAFHPSR